MPPRSFAFASAPRPHRQEDPVAAPPPPDPADDHWRELAALGVPLVPDQPIRSVARRLAEERLTLVVYSRIEGDAPLYEAAIQDPGGVGRSGWCASRDLVV